MRFYIQLIVKVFASFVAAALIAGCGSGSAKPFSAQSSTSQTSGASTATASGTSFTAGNNTTSTTNSGSSTATSTGSSNSGTSNGNSSAASDAQASAAPENAIVFDAIQTQPGWQTCGGCGNVGAVGAGPDYNMTQGISDPSLSGRAADFFVNGGPAYAGGYFFIEQPVVPNPLTYLRYDFDLFVPGRYADSPQALEFECQQTINGMTYNFAWQADYLSNTWRVFNYSTKDWEPTQLRLHRFTPDKWHHVTAIYHTAGTQIIHDSLVIDGEKHDVNITHEATQTGTRPEFTAAFQLDMDGRSTPYHVFVDNMKVSLTD